MLQDSPTYIAGAVVKGFTIESGAAFPAQPVDGQKFRLTTATATYEAGEYTYNLANTEWTNPLVEIAKNPIFAASGKKGSNVGLAAGAIPTVPPQVYDIGFQILGKPDAAAVVGRFVAVRGFKIPAGATGSAAKSGVAATASTVLSAKKNGVQFGTITFAAGATTGTFAVAAETTFAAGDVFTVTAAATQDAAFADAQITFITSLS